MAKVRIVLNSPGVAALLKSPRVHNEMFRYAEEIAARAGAGMEASSMVGRTRARASVITATREARKAEATGRDLTRAITGQPPIDSGLRPYTTKSGRTIMATPQQIANWRRGW